MPARVQYEGINGIFLVNTSDLSIIVHGTVAVSIALRFVVRQTIQKTALCVY